MIWLYITELTTIAAAVILTLWLRREGDRSWERHQRRLRRTRIAAIEAAMGLEAPSLAKFMTDMVRAGYEFERAMQGLERALQTPVKPLQVSKFKPRGKR